jgi:hypothetical protein
VTALVVDTDVLIEYLRGREQPVDYLHALNADLLLSSLTVAELFAGARDDEIKALRTMLGAFGVVAVDAAIAEAAGRLRRRYGPSHGTGLSDAVIAATVEASGARLVTFNSKHFPMLEVIVPYER